MSRFDFEHHLQVCEVCVGDYILNIGMMFFRHSQTTVFFYLCVYCKEENQCPSALIARRFSWWRVPVQCEPCHSAAFGYLCSKTSLKHPSTAFRKLCGQRSCAYGFGAFLFFHYAFNGSN